MGESIFPHEVINFKSGSWERVIRGGRDKFPLLAKAFLGVNQICVLGWRSQGPAQAQNIRDSLKAIGSNIKVVVGLREDSKSRVEARYAGFNEDDGTLGETYKVISESDLVILLIADTAQTEEYQKVFDAMKPGSTLGLSHGFLEGYLQGIGGHFREDINVVMVAPKGMGDSVRRLYLQGLETNGSGINSSIAVYQDVTGTAQRIVEGWSIAIGSPVTFETTLQMEWRSDIFGERGILLGALWGLSEALYEVLVSKMDEGKAFENSVLSLTSFISPQISKLGLDGFYDEFIVTREQDKSFRAGYKSAYKTFVTVMEEIYEEVSSGREIQDVINGAKKPMGSIEEESMWKVGERVRNSGVKVDSLSVEGAFTAGVYVAAVMAQFHVLKMHKHCISEIINESLIEGTDSLTPYMNARGVAFMVDNCSRTARLGTRKWGPVFKKALLASIGARGTSLDNGSWLRDSIHADIATCYGFKPAVAIAVV